MKRYVWKKYGRVYHDTNVSMERCNCDQLIAYLDGDEPPEDKRLCRWCARHAQQIMRQR